MKNQNEATITVKVVDGVAEVVSQENIKFVHVFEQSPGRFAITVEAEEPKPTPLNIPWGSIDERWQWAAMDENHAICLFDTKPFAKDFRWSFGRGDFKDVSGAFAIVTEDINWKLSLTERPDPQIKPPHPFFDKPVGPQFNCRCTATPFIDSAIIKSKMEDSNSLFGLFGLFNED